MLDIMEHRGSYVREDCETYLIFQEITKYGVLQWQPSNITLIAKSFLRILAYIVVSMNFGLSCSFLTERLRHACLVDVLPSRHVSLS